MNDRFLKNENFPSVTVAWLRPRGDDVIHATESHSGSTDEELLAAARSDSRILLTFDRDFGELIFHHRHPPARGAVLFRLKQQSPTIILPFLEAFFQSNPSLEGFYTVASPGQFRQAKLPG